MNLKEEIITFPMGINLVFVFHFFFFLSNISNEDRMVTKKEFLWIKVCIFFIHNYLRFISTVYKIWNFIARNFICYFRIRFFYHYHFSYIMHKSCHQMFNIEENKEGIKPQENYLLLNYLNLCLIIQLFAYTTVSTLNSLNFPLVFFSLKNLLDCFLNWLFAGTRYA